MNDSTRWKINALIGEIEQIHAKLGMRDCQLKARTDGVWRYEGDATEAYEIIDRIEQRLKTIENKGSGDEGWPAGLAESTRKTVDWLNAFGGAGELKKWLARHPQREVLESYLRGKHGQTQA
jgi:hypothetical protein